MAGSAGTALAASRETGRERDNPGITRFRVKAARDGNDDDPDGGPGEDSEGGGSRASLSGGAGGGVEGEGVRGGGGCDSEVFHASRAASSSRFASGSNWFRISVETLKGDSSASIPAIMDLSSNSGSGVLKGMSSIFP